MSNVRQIMAKGETSVLLRNELDYLDSAERELLLKQAGIISHIGATQALTLKAGILVSGRPRHPQSQGVVEQAHYTLERMLSAKVAEQKSCKPPWSMWLPHIVCEYVFFMLQFFLYSIHMQSCLLF